MKKFISAQIITENGDDILSVLLDLIDEKLIVDKKLILKDIELHESLKDGKVAHFKNIFVHTARSFGISDFCLSASQFSGGNLEILILWNEISEHNLGKLSEIADFLAKSTEKGLPHEEIITSLSKL